MGNIFIKDEDEYIRHIDPVATYIRQASFYKNKMLSTPIDVAKEDVINAIKKSDIVNPKVKFNNRNSVTGDMEVNYLPLREYIKTNISKDRIIVPSFTVYNHPDKLKSFLSDYTADNVKLRNEDKKKMYYYREKNEPVLENMYNNLQKTRKIKNNGLTGALASSKSSLFMASGHYTATSMTRTATSIANATTESIVTGTKLYITEKIAFNHIVFLAMVADKEKISTVIKKYNLHVPTSDEFLETVHHSTKLYWDNKDFDSKAIAFYNKLDDEEKVNIIYNNSLYHIRVFNNDFIKTLFTNLNEAKIDLCEGDWEKTFYELDPSITNVAYHRFLFKIRSSDLSKDFDLTDKKDVLANNMVSTSINIDRILGEYQDFFNVFFRENTIPPNISHMRDSTRRCTVLSDTDSTCATYQEWVEWFYGNVKFTDESNGLSALVMMITSQVVEHYLRQYTTNMGVPTDKRKSITYKGEFYWPTMTPMAVSKHYYADQLVQERKVFKKDKLERKGVNLISSNIPISIQNTFENMLMDINHTTRSNQELDISKYLRIVSSIEKDILQSIKEGKSTYLMNVSIQEKSSYANGEDSPYFHYILWERVFSSKYGSIDRVPYLGKKLPITTHTKDKMNVFISKIEDEEIRTNFQNLLKEKGKDYIGTIVLPASFVSNNGIPVELLDIVDVNRLCNGICKPFYMTLETLSVFKKQDDIFLNNIIDTAD